MAASVLIVDDEEDINKMLRRLLKQRGYNVYSTLSGEEGLEVFKTNDVDVVILDLKLPGIDGIKVLSELMKIDREVPVIMITAYGELDTAVEAMKLGARDFVKKPFEFDEIEVAIRKELEVRSLRNRVDSLERQVRRTQYAEMVGASKPMQEVFQTIDKLSYSANATVLITGETGTGKELAARAIHEKSPRKDKPFEVVNCTILHEQLLESELFGHERGAFTDAKETRHGLFEIADEGTVFFDEIADMGLKMQAKILRVLEERSFRRLGSNKNIEVDVRILAATNRDLEEEVEKGNFREDLFYRLNVVVLKLPPLRERKEDILRLANKFVADYCSELRRPTMKFSNDAIHALLSYEWPGNVRELRNLMERIAILESGDQITLQSLPDKMRNRVEGMQPIPLPELNDHYTPFKEAKQYAIEAFEKRYLMDILQRNDGSVTRSAQEAGMDRRNFQRLLRKHMIRSKDFRPEAKSSSEK